MPKSEHSIDWRGDDVGEAVAIKDGEPVASFNLEKPGEQASMIFEVEIPHPEKGQPSVTVPWELKFTRT